jgi:hypothetical protein
MYMCVRRHIAVSTNSYAATMQAIQEAMAIHVHLVSLHPLLCHVISFGAPTPNISRHQRYKLGVGAPGYISRDHKQDGARLMYTVFYLKRWIFQFGTHDLLEPGGAPAGHYLIRSRRRPSPSISVDSEVARMR